jgi:hypothetical protein
MRIGVTVVLVVTLAACGSGTSGGAPLPSASRTAPAALPVPSSYAQACALEASVCTSASTQAVDATLLETNDLSSIAAGAPCPVSHGTPLTTSSFGGIVFGSGPVHALLSSGGDAVTTARIEAGHVRLVTTASTGGWRGFKTLWFADGGYTGAFAVSGRRLDGTGAVAFGEQPAVSRLLVPPNATVNVGADGEREAPGGSWLTAPGCYGWEVRTPDHTETIVFSVEG